MQKCHGGFNNVSGTTMDTKSTEWHETTTTRECETSTITETNKYENVESRTKTWGQDQKLNRSYITDQHRIRATKIVEQVASNWLWRETDELARITNIIPSRSEYRKHGMGQFKITDAMNDGTRKAQRHCEDGVPIAARPMTTQWSAFHMSLKTQIQKWSNIYNKGIAPCLMLDSVLNRIVRDCLHIAPRFPLTIHTRVMSLHHILTSCFLSLLIFMIDLFFLATTFFGPSPLL